MQDQLTLRPPKILCITRFFWVRTSVIVQIAFDLLDRHIRSPELSIQTWGKSISTRSDDKPPAGKPSHRSTPTEPWKTHSTGSGPSSKTARSPTATGHA